MIRAPRTLDRGSVVFFLVNGVGKLDIRMQKKSWTYLTPLRKINLKWSKNLNVRPEIIKSVEENIGEKLLDLTLGVDVLGMTLEAQLIKAQMHQWGYNKLKKVLLNTGNNILKRQPTGWEKIFVNYISDKGLISKIHEELVQLSGTEKVNNTV